MYACLGLMKSATKFIRPQGRVWALGFGGLGSLWVFTSGLAKEPNRFSDGSEALWTCILVNGVREVDLHGNYAHGKPSTLDPYARYSLRPETLSPKSQTISRKTSQTLSPKP